jgi:hydroxymethylbilane synthase
VSAGATLRLGTRGSELALTQSTTIAEALRALGLAVELTIIKTAGDKNTTSAFGSIGPQGVFVREIEPELMIGAVPQRVDPADLLLVRREARTGDDWLPLVAGARVGTASARRGAWLKSFRPDLRVLPLRGNVPTRVRRLEEGAFDAIVLAAAGVERLQAEQRLGSALTGLAVLRLDPQRFVPAPAQGALAVQCRRDDERVRAALAHIDHAPSRTAVTAERDALARAEGGCDVAFGAYCVAVGAQHELVAMLERGGTVHTARVRGADPATLGAAAWSELAAEAGAAP